MSKVSLSEKDLSLLSDLLAYEKWASQKSQMYSETLADPVSKGICKQLEQNHSNNFAALYNFLNQQ